MSKLKVISGPPFMPPPIGKMATFLIFHQLLIANLLIPNVALDLLLARRDFIRSLFYFMLEAMSFVLWISRQLITTKRKISKGW